MDAIRRGRGVGAGVAVDVGRGDGARTAGVGSAATARVASGLGVAVGAPATAALRAGGQAVVAEEVGEEDVGSLFANRLGVVLPNRHCRLHGRGEFLEP